MKKARHGVSGLPGMRASTLPLECLEPKCSIQSETLFKENIFHKKKVFMGFLFGGEADNHAVNTVPKETLVKVVKAEDGGLGGKGIWKPGKAGYSPEEEDAFMQEYLAGSLVKVKKS